MNLFINQLKELIKEVSTQTTLEILHQSGQKVTEQENDLIPIEEAMKLTGFTKASIYTMTSQRRIPHFKVGRRLVFKRSELLEWIQSKKRKTLSELQNEANQDFSPEI